MAFAVASVKPDTGPFRPPNFPLDASDAFRSVGGHFSADFPLGVYFTFAYKLPLKEGQHFPDWVYDRFDIQAEAEGNPTQRPDAADDAVAAGGPVTAEGSR